MKKFTCQLLFSLLTLIPTLSFANTIIVKGYLKTTSNLAVANKTVKIVLDSSINAPCNLVHTVTTNPNGYYIDTISCSGEINKVKVLVENCDGSLLTNLAVRNAGSSYIESNFTLCQKETTPAPVCKAKIAVKVTGFSVLFNSDSSTTATGDSIVQRYWLFGDGTSADGNKVSTTHQYNKAGTYEACLYTKTAKGCESKVCTAVSIVATTASCKAVISVEKTAARTFRFSSSASVAGSGDTIKYRTWRFGDGTLLEGTEISALKTYKDTGTYNVCVVIKTVKGCESTFCITVSVKDSASTPAPVCKAQFSWKADGINGLTIAFNSLNSNTSTGDSITKRYWIFGDSSSADGNKATITHTYKKPGRYEVCLYTATAKGCQSKICGIVEIPEINTACKAQFSWKADSLNRLSIVFSSHNSVTSTGDSITKRYWIFGDSSSADGNKATITHTYKKPGRYEVCLYTVTAKGCQSKICGIVEIPEINTACKAYFISEYLGQRTFKFTSKSEAAAGDSILHMIWRSGDSNLVAGNPVSFQKTFKDTGTYTICLKIITKKGCESYYCGKVTIKDSTPVPQPQQCKAYFSFSRTAGSIGSIQFNSTSSVVPDGDSIISRTWVFGDSTEALTGNRKDPTHVYAKTGQYQVCLIIKTKKGCESRYCTTIAIAPVNTACYAQFSDERVSINSIRFNSANSKALPGDSIIERKWKFGDGTVLTGNVVNPLKVFPLKGIYTVCLQIKTAQGCSSDICKVFEIRDTASTTNPANLPTIRIITINPNPVITRLLATIWSKNGVEAELSIYDIYGVRKWSGKKALLSGNNIAEVPVLDLKAGPYFLHVITATGKDSKMFYKL